MRQTVSDRLMLGSAIIAAVAVAYALVGDWGKVSALEFGLRVMLSALALGALVVVYWRRVRR